MPAIHSKRLVTVTLDIMCHSDLELESDEDIHVNVKEFDIDW